MNANTPQFVLIGRNSTILENYRREISTFDVCLMKSATEISSLEKISGIFFDAETVEETKSALEVIKKLSKEAFEVPIIVIFPQNQLLKGEFQLLDSSFRVLKKPLSEGELLHEVENLVYRASVEAKKIQNERLASIRQVLKGLSHELGNILLRIMGKTDLALMEEDVEKIHSGLKGVVTASEKAIVLVKNLQAFAKSSPHLAKGRLSTAIEGSLKKLEPELKARKIGVQKKGLLKNIKDEPEVDVDLSAIGQVFFNLFENAIPDSGDLIVDLMMSAEKIELRIIDTGVGMTPDVLKHAFEFTFSTRKDVASGLGLPIAREIIRSHGGTLDLQSSPGKGTEILIWLPRSTC
jgi:signal transduction histidine kinase